MASSYFTFAKNTGTGVQTVLGVSGVLNKAMVIFSERQATYALSDGYQLYQGVTDGVIQACRAVGATDNQANHNSSQCERNDLLVYMTNQTSGATPTVEVSGSFVQFNADGGFDINWLVNDGVASIFHVFMFDVPAAKLKAVELDTTVVVSDLTFRPVGFVVTSGDIGEAGADAPYNLGAPFGSFHGLGFSDGTQQLCAWCQSIGGAGGGDEFRADITLDACHDNRVANLTGGDDLTRGTITAITANGFTLNRTFGTFTPLSYILCLGGAGMNFNFKMGQITCPAAPGTKTTSLGFEADAVLLVSHGSALGITIGAIRRVGSVQGGVCAAGLFGVSPSVTCRETYNTHAMKSYVPTATGSGSTARIAATGSIGASSFDLVFSSTPGTSAKILYMAISRAASPTTPAVVMVNSVPDCCSSGASGVNTGPVTAFVGPDWTPACTGGGTVPSSADLTASETWDY